MQKKTVLRIIFFALIILWMIVVFQLSNQNGEDSSSLSKKIASFFTSNEQIIEKIEPYIRKLAHLSEYAVGGVLFLDLFLTYEFSEKKQILFSSLVGVEYAILDEIHQLLIARKSRENS